jgi:hypothetical protein
MPFKAVAPEETGKSQPAKPLGVNTYGDKRNQQTPVPYGLGKVPLRSNQPSYGEDGRSCSSIESPGSTKNFVTGLGSAGGGSPGSSPPYFPYGDGSGVADKKLSSTDRKKR